MTYAYDGFNQMVSRTDALGKSDVFGYDEEGNQTSHTDRNGTVSNMK